MASCQPQAVYRIAKKYPKLNIVVCHLLAPSPSDEDKELVAFALPYLKHDNVWIDLAALPWNSAPESYPYPSALGYIRMAKETLGADKICWGTDVPAVLTKDSFAHITDYIGEGNIFTPAELEQVFYSNAKRAYYLK
jgi:predicted TIM-barrel fold metal-dependent hydrolase